MTAAAVEAVLHWLDRGSLGALTIRKGDTTTVYTLHAEPPQYRLLNAATGIVYGCRLGLRATRDCCSCPDARFRRRGRGCKHVRGLRAALGLGDGLRQPAAYWGFAKASS
jgi:hypothetical protein